MHDKGQSRYAEGGDRPVIEPPGRQDSPFGVPEGDGSPRRIDRQVHDSRRIRGIESGEPPGRAWTLRKPLIYGTPLVPRQEDDLHAYRREPPRRGKAGDPPELGEHQGDGRVALTLGPVAMLVEGGDEDQEIIVPSRNPDGDRRSVGLVVHEIVQGIHRGGEPAGFEEGGYPFRRGSLARPAFGTRAKGAKLSQKGFEIGLELRGVDPVAGEPGDRPRKRSPARRSLGHGGRGREERDQKGRAEGRPATFCHAEEDRRDKAMRQYGLPRR